MRGKETMGTQLFQLDSTATEVVFAPFHDPMITRSLGVELQPLGASHCELSYYWWCWLTIVWEQCPPGQDAAQLSLPCGIDLGRFDQFIACLNLPTHVSVRFAACVDGTWRELGGETPGQGKRMEVTPHLPQGRLTGVRAIFRAQANAPATLHLSWFGLADSKLVRQIEAARLPWNPAWPELIVPSEGWKEIKFGRGLFFDAADLPRLREKKKLPGWRENFAVLEQHAQHCLQREPEADIGEFLPWNDIRYSRAREHGKEPYFWEPLVLGLVGLVNNDERMMRHAVRYLMCMAHTTHWCQSAESRLKGSTWDQRCFIEEMATTACAILLDWFDFALTDRARDLVRQAIWDKGLAIIERDMMKFEYVHHINQGPWFCRARVLGGLMLEQAWPRVGEYADRAFREQRAAMNNYILADGGTDEGVGYFSVTVTTVLWSVMAYARARQQDPHALLPEHLPRSDRFVATMSAVEPGKTLLDGDQTTDYFTGDTIPMLASLFPGSVYTRILANVLPRPRPSTDLPHYILDSFLGFVFGPEQIEPAQTIVPTFSVLDRVGQLTSLRRQEGHSVRLHVTGAKAHASHTHLDKGAFTLELNGVPFLIDRGMVRYDDWRSGILHRTYLHNVITPCRSDGTWPDQAAVEQPVIPTGAGDERQLRAEIDLAHVWREQMNRCRRVLHADSFEEFTVEDTGELKTESPIAFHLHASWPFRIDGKRVILEHGGIALEIVADWAVTATQREDLIDYRFEPVQHLVLLSRPLTTFKLQTRFRTA
jgi:Heparinase II/III-like protein